MADFLGGCLHQVQVEHVRAGEARLQLGIKGVDQCRNHVFAVLVSRAKGRRIDVGDAENDDVACSLRDNLILHIAG